MTAQICGSGASRRIIARVLNISILACNQVGLNLAWFFVGYTN
jgi:hypothetical protein